MRFGYLTAGILLAVCIDGSALAATDVAKAEAARKKPLQRCDELTDKAELECLKKARERIVEARKKRETVGQARPAGKSGSAGDVKDAKAAERAQR